MKSSFEKPAGLQLLDAALTYIEFHPDEWNQDVYRCKTGGCIAYHIAVTMAGGKLASSDPSDENLIADPEVDQTCFGTVPMSRRARALLGNAYVPGMFDAGNDRARLYSYRNQAAKKLATLKVKELVDQWD